MKNFFIKINFKTDIQINFRYIFNNIILFIYLVFK